MWGAGPAGSERGTVSITDDTAFVDAIAQAELVRRGDVNAKELIEAAMERIELLNPGVNAVVTPMYE